MTPALLGLALGAASPALADPERAVDASVHGDAKSFFFASFPYDHLLFVADPTDLSALDDPQADPSGQALVDGRLKLEVDGWDGLLGLELHGTVTASAPGTFTSTGTGFVQTGQGTPQAVDLKGELVTGGGMDAWTRIDRAALRLSVPHLDLTLGRQPVTLGRALFFTPLDLVGPFSPTVVDQEYKPGVDALRVDGYVGMATQFTAVAAYGAPAPGDWSLDHLVLAGMGQTTVGAFDLGLFAGSVHRDGVFGLSVAGSAGSVGLRTEGAVTLPSEASGDDPYLRGIVGADYFFGDVSLSGEVYYQGVGAASPDGYLVQATGDRYARGELWALGRWYSGLSVGWQAFPRLTGSLAVIANLADPSALVGPGLAWSVGENSSVVGGAYVGLGERPGDVTLQTLLSAGLGPSSTEADFLAAIPVNSEFGLVPATAFVEWMAYF
jgi:hypothetical protein